MSTYAPLLSQLDQMLSNIDRWLTRAEEHAADRKFDVAILLQARLAPDQFPLVRQVQAVCDAAKFLGARLTGKEAPKNPDAETTVAQVRERIAGTRAWLSTLTEADFEGAETRQVTLAFAPGKYVLGADYLRQMALPNFYFHAATAYAILRHNGVTLGKVDFLGAITLHDA